MLWPLASLGLAWHAQRVLSRAKTADGRPLCALCGEVIGVFEPLIRHLEGRADETSLAAQPGLEVGAGDLYHRPCFDRI